MSNTKLKASDKQALFRKVATTLKKKFGGSVPKHKLNVFDTLLFACCLENVSQEDAEAAYGRVLESFHDLNEMRVSSVKEIEHALGSVDGAAWKALRIRESLQYVFEKYYAFDFEPLRRKTMDAAEKQLAEIRHLSPFVSNYVLEMSLDSHVVPMDDVTTEIVTWMGFVAPETSTDKTTEEMKSCVKKSDVALLCHLLRQLGTDKKYKGTFRVTKALQASGEIDPEKVASRLEGHLKNPAKKLASPSKKSTKPSSKKATKTKKKKPAAVSRKKAPAKKAARKGPPKSPTKKKTAKKVTKKKPTAKKKAAKKRSSRK